MRVAAKCVLAELVGLAILAGCVRATCSNPRAPFQGGFSTSEPLESATAPKRASLEGLSLPNYETIDRALGKSPKPAAYWLLSESECQCRAAANSTLGNLLASQSESVAALCAGRRDRDGPARSLLAQLLACRAVDERNRSAGAALELFYRLAEAYFNQDQLERALVCLRQALRQIEQAKASGLGLPGDDAPLRRQELDLVDRAVQLHAAVCRLDRELGHLLGLEADQTHALWPVVDLKVTVERTDADEAVATGLASRADLALFSVLADELSPQTLPAARGVLARLDPLLAGLAPRRSFLGGTLYQGQIASEAEVRHGQLQELLAAQRRAAEDEIRRAAADVETTLRQVGLAKDKLDHWDRQLRRLQEDRKARGSVSPLEVTAAQLEVYQAETELFKALIQWKIALVKLKQSQGLLASECGYTPCSIVGG